MCSRPDSEPLDGESHEASDCGQLSHYTGRELLEQGASERSSLIEG
jgi:hypothetical protein